MMKHARWAFALTLSAAGCNGCKDRLLQIATDAEPPTTASPPGPSAAEPSKLVAGAQLVERYKSCAGWFGAGKVDEVARVCIARQYKGHVVDIEEIPDRDALLARVKAMRMAFPRQKLRSRCLRVADLRDVEAEVTKLS